MTLAPCAYIWCDSGSALFSLLTDMVPFSWSLRSDIVVRSLSARLLPMCWSSPHLVLFFQSLFKECTTFGNTFCLVRKHGLRLVFLLLLFGCGILFRCRPESVVVGLSRSSSLQFLRGAVYLNQLIFLSWTLSLLLLATGFPLPFSWGVSLSVPIRTDSPGGCNAAWNHIPRWLVNLEPIAVAIGWASWGLPLKTPL